MPDNKKMETQMHFTLYKRNYIHVYIVLLSGLFNIHIVYSPEYDMPTE